MKKHNLNDCEQKETLYRIYHDVHTHKYLPGPDPCQKPRTQLLQPHPATYWTAFNMLNQFV